MWGRIRNEGFRREKQIYSDMLMVKKRKGMSAMFMPAWRNDILLLATLCHVAVTYWRGNDGHDAVCGQQINVVAA
jgi:hypothetical protein